MITPNGLSTKIRKVETEFDIPRFALGNLREDSNAEYLIQQPWSGVSAPIGRDLSETDDMLANLSPARGLIFGMSLGSLFWLVILLVWTLSG